MGNRRHNSASLVSLEATPQNWAPWSPCGRLALELLLLADLVHLNWAGSRTTELHSLQSTQIGPWNPEARRLGSPKPSQQQSHETKVPEALVGNQAPGPAIWRLGPPFLWSTALPSWSSQPGKQAPELLLSKGLVPCASAVTMAPSSPPASKLQGLCYLKTWVSHTCSSCCGSWKPTPQCK
jgi:hypothetical protein